MLKLYTHINIINIFYQELISLIANPNRKMTELKNS